MSNRTNESREFEVEGKKIGSAADCYIVADADGLEEGGDIRARDATLAFLARCGVDAARVHCRSGAGADETIKAVRRRGLSAMAAAYSTRSLYALAKNSVSILEMPATGLNDPMLLAEICGAKTPLIISATAREMEDIAHLIEELAEERGNFAIMWSPGDETDRQMNLRKISALRDLFPTRVIGFSAPPGGELHGVGALALGAWILEIKLAADWKENEAASEAFRLAVRDLRRVGQAL